MIKGYETKDVKASKTKKSEKEKQFILKKRDTMVLQMGKWTRSFTTEENAKIALERLSNEQ